MSKENIIVNEEKDLAGNKAAGDNNGKKRFLALSSKYRIAGFIGLFLVVIFILGMVIVFRDDITYENFNYMFRDLDTLMPEYTGQRGTVYFDASGDRSMVPFRGSLAIISPKNISFYNLKGSNTFTDSFSMSKPLSSVSVKYLLVYDIGGNTYKLYNGYTFSEGEETEYPITAGAVSDSGVYAVATKNLQYRTVVDVFNENYHKTATIYKDRYISDLKISSSGEKIIILTVNGNGGQMNSEISVVSPTGSEPLFETTLDGVYAVSCNFFKDGGFNILTDSGVYFYDGKYNLINTYGNSADSVLNYYTYGNYCGVVIRKNIVGYNSALTILDSRGNIVSTQSLSGEILGMTASDNGFFFLHNGSLDRISFYGQKDSAALPSSPNTIVVDNGNIIIGFSGSAVIYPETNLFLSKGKASGE